MERYLITGGAGFIGSHIAERLLKDGHFVRILDNFSCGRMSNLSFAKDLGLDRFEVLQGDINDPDMCHKACVGINYVFHQAGLKSVPKSLLEPLQYNQVNINGILYLLQAAAAAKVKRFVFASSSSVYGDSKHFPQQEEQYPLLMSPYALSKLAGEYYCRIYSEHFGLETVALRYFNVFGPRQPMDDEYSAVIPKFIYAMLDGKSPTVFGDGLQSRDFTYIDNVVSANLTVLHTDGIKHEVFNAAVGHEYTILDIVEGINKALGTQIQPQFLPKRAGDIYRSQADISKITTKTSYRPLITFADGLAKTVHFIKQHR